MSIPRDLAMIARAVPNPDKEHHEKWPVNMQGYDLGRLPRPFRMILAGPPSCGKGTAVLSTFLRARPAFKSVVVVHPDPPVYDENGERQGGTREWDAIEPTLITDYIPGPEDAIWQGDGHKACILDDVELHGLGKDQKRALSRLFGYVSTHHDVSVFLCVQDVWTVPPAVRRCANVFVLWGNLDTRSIAALAGRLGMPPDDLQELLNMARHRGVHSSLWLDATDRTPAPIRLDCYDVVTRSAPTLW